MKFSKPPITTAAALLALAAAALPAQAQTVTWVDWTAASNGASGSASGVIDLGAIGADSSDIEVSYSGEVAFAQVSGGTNYYATGPNSTYQSAAVANRPPSSDIIALSQATSKTLTFSAAVDNLFFAVVSLNGNGYQFNEDFTIESFGAGYWGNGTLTKQDMGDGTYRLIGTGEPHGVIRFNRPVSSITWTSLTNEYWNGFTVGTYGAAAPIPEPTSALLFAGGLAALAGLRMRRRRQGLG